jgi:hypothetical protein
VVQEAAINRAIGESQSIQRRAEATAKGVKMIADAITCSGGGEAVSMHLAQQYVDAFGKIAKEGNTMIVPADASNVASMIATAAAVFKGNVGTGGGSSVAAESEQATKSTPAAPTSSAQVESSKATGRSVLDRDGDNDTNAGHQMKLPEMMGDDMLEKMLLPPGRGAHNTIGFSLSK